MNDLNHRLPLATLFLLPALGMVACAGNAVPPQVTAPSTTMPMATRVDDKNPIITTASSDKLDIDSGVEIQNSESRDQQPLFPLIPEKPTDNVIFFAFDVDQLTDKAAQTLRKHADYLLAHPEASVYISGHTDSFGSRLYNQHLSRKRAQQVVNRLVEYGVDEKQLHIQAMADDQPYAQAKSPRQNRRVEINYPDNELAHLD